MANEAASVATEEPLPPASAPEPALPAESPQPPKAEPTTQKAIREPTKTAPGGAPMDPNRGGKHLSLSTHFLPSPLIIYIFFFTKVHLKQIKEEETFTLTRVVYWFCGICVHSSY